MTDASTLNIIANIEEDKIKYASEVIKIDFVTDYIKTVNARKISYLNEHVNRFDTISKFSALLKDIESGIKIEAGIFEFTLVYCATNNYILQMISAVYNEKVYDLLQNLKSCGPIDNTFVLNAINNNTINPQLLAFMKPHELNPDRWADIIKKNVMREEKKKNMAVTDLYQCWKCKERKCRVMEMQTRSSDEPMTKFITCMNCFTVMKK
ncbi:zinc finger TFIIS-type protein [Fadolivirus algeromassiliense]|jgi:transcription elongation factor S-II|uniref:Zinc finger TFIIS-type protein n=1 Tax=Fadolivirus FV1/VV64 TaxID=3070911 RepID=A0A7D3QVG5_9VIRU|nr:zinc finger TFIIS-type protein [Fadolivirus algeromassiliense]QKF93806.1 zinc finger TFIIS-type protein [Fadolivirus FV1/VV64]